MDFSRLLDPVSEDAPSGVELRNDPQFHAIERLLEPAARENKLNSDGTLNESAPDADWQAVLDGALELAQEGRDLRLLVILLRAVAAQDGFSGLAEGLAFLGDTIEGYWGDLHPALRDRDDAKAAALPRINALKQLENDDNGLLGDLKYSILLNMRGIGAIPGMYLAQAALSEFEYLNHVASGLNESEKADLAAKHSQIVNRVNAGCRALAAEEAERAAETIAELVACEAAIDTLSEKLSAAGGFGADKVLNLPELSEFIAQVRAVFEAGVAAMAEDGDPDAAGDTGAADTAAPAAAAPASGAASSAASSSGSTSAPGSIGSRGDVEKSLSAIIAFYERTEPSSPIPHLARRMRRMVKMDFLELMEEIAPSGLKEFSNVAGVEVKKK